ncbi:MAG: FtsX-like permease family protein [Candidatus Thermoplasmatota archaeon]
MMIVKNILRRKVRTALSMAAVGIATALLISMLSIADGILKTTYESIQRSKEDIAIAGTAPHAIENGHEIAKKLMGFEEIEIATPTLGGILAMNTSKGVRSAFAYGVIPKHGWEILSEKERKMFDGWFSIEGDIHYERNYTGEWSKEILISSSIAKDFNLKKEDRIEVGKTSNGPWIIYKVVGIFKTELSGGGALSGIYFVSLPLSELQSIINLDIMEYDSAQRNLDAVDRVSIMVKKEISGKPKKIEELVNKIKEEYPWYEDEVLTKDEKIKAAEKQVMVATVFQLTIGTISVLIGILFVACVMIISVFERTNEIGMMRAIGISRKTIFFIILFESLVIVLVGCFLGIIPGYYGSQILSNYFEDNFGLNLELFSFDFWLIIRTILIAVVPGTFISLYPAWLATKISVIRAIKYVG